MKSLVCMVSILAVLITTPAASQHPSRLGGSLVDGSVVRARGCGNYFFVAYRDEFALAERLGGEMVKENDVLQANDDQASFEHEGRMTLTDLATNRTVDIVIEKTLMNRADFSVVASRICKSRG